MSTLPPRHPHSSTSRTGMPRPTDAWRPRLRTSVVAAVTAGGLACGTFLMAASPVNAATPAPSAGCVTAQEALEEEFGELELDDVTSAMVTGWLMRLRDTSAKLHETERARDTAEAEADAAREVLGGLIDDTLEAQGVEEAARAELAAAQEADPADPDRVAAAEEALAAAQEALAAAQQAEEEAEVVLEDAEAALRGRQGAFEQAGAELDALIAEVDESTAGYGEGDWAKLRDMLAAVEKACEGGGSTPPPTPAPEPAVKPVTTEAPVAEPVTGKARFTG